MRKRGFTLIEVVIALAIFVVGALAVVRIFPPALGVVQNSGYSSVATRLSDSILSQMKGEGSTPEAVFDIDDSGNWATNPIEVSWRDPFFTDPDTGKTISFAVVGTASQNASLPKGPTDNSFTYSALNYFRFIRGEKQTIQNADSIDPANPPYVLTNFPYATFPLAGTPTTPSVQAYIEMQISGVTMNASGQLDFTNATAINPITGGTIPFNGANDSDSTDTPHIDRPPRYLILSPNVISGTFPQANGLNLISRSLTSSGYAFTGTRYYVSYRWIDAGSSANIQQGVVDEPLNLPDDTMWDNDVTANGNVDRVLEGVRARNDSNIKLLAGSVQVKARVFLASLPQSPSADQAKLGYVPLPVVKDTTGTVSLLSGMSFYLDYLVPDWRHMINDSNPVQDTSGTLGMGDVLLPVSLVDQTSVTGLFINATATPNQVTGPFTPDSTRSDFKKGKLVYTNSVNQRVRSAYQGIDDWAMQPSPTAESYVPYVSETQLMGISSLPYPRDYSATPEYYYLPREPWREYYCTLGEASIYFHASEAGKAVKVSFIDSTGKTWQDQTGIINKNLETSPDANFSNGLVASVKFADPSNPNNYLTIASILSVRGVSVTARTAWLNGKTYQQSVVTGYRVASAD